MTLNNEIKPYNLIQSLRFFKERESSVGPVSLKMVCISYKCLVFSSSTEIGIHPTFFMENL